MYVHWGNGLLDRKFLEVSLHNRNYFYWPIPWTAFIENRFVPQCSPSSPVVTYIYFIYWMSGHWIRSAGLVFRWLNNRWKAAVQKKKLSYVLTCQTVIIVSLYYTFGIYRMQWIRYLIGFSSDFFFLCNVIYRQDGK